MGTQPPPQWSAVPIDDVVRVALRPHAVENPPTREFAIGFFAVIFVRPGVLGRRYVPLPTARFDRKIQSDNRTDALFQALTLALNGVHELRPDLTQKAWSAFVTDNNVARALAYSDRPQKWENIPLAAKPQAAPFLEAKARWKFKGHINNLAQPQNRAEARRRSKLFRQLEERLVLGQFGLLRRPRRQRPVMVDAEKLGALLATVHADPARAPPVLEGLVTLLREDGFSHERIAQALQVEKQVCYNAQARWTQRAKKQRTSRDGEGFA